MKKNIINIGIPSKGRLRKDILNINRIENNGYLDNYVLFDSELRDIRKLIEFFKSS